MVEIPDSLVDDFWGGLVRPEYSGPSRPVQVERAVKEFRTIKTMAQQSSYILIRRINFNIRFHTAKCNGFRYVSRGAPNRLPAARGTYAGQICPIYDCLGANGQTGRQEIIADWTHRSD